MENKGLTAYERNGFTDRKKFLNKNIFHSELLTLADAKYDDSGNLIVDFQKINGKSILYVFFNESVQRELMSDVVGYSSHNPYPQSYMKIENMVGKKVEVFFIIIVKT
jgi:hypothetical protein